MSKHKIVPSEDGISMEEAMLEFNSMYVPLSSISERYSSIPDDQKSKLFGMVAGSIDSKVNKAAKNLGLELEGKKTSETVELIVQSYETKIAELSNKLTNHTKDIDAAIKAEIDALKQQNADLLKLNEKIKTDLDSTIKVKTEIEQSYTEKEKQLEIARIIEKAKAKHILVEDQNTRDACEWEIAKLDISKDLDGNVVVRDEKGTAILSKVTTGFATFDEVLNDIYTKRNAHKKIVGAGNATPLTDIKSITPVGGRTLAPR